MSVRICGDRGEKHCRGRTCPAVGVVAEAVEEDDCGEGGRRAGGGDDYGWMIGHDQKGR